MQPTTLSLDIVFQNEHVWYRAECRTGGELCGEVSQNTNLIISNKPPVGIANLGLYMVS